MKHDAVAEIGAFLRGQNGPELALHFFRFLALGQSQKIGDADAVGVADHGAGNGVQVAQQQVGGFAAHAGQPQQLVHGAGHLPAVFVAQHPAGQHNVPGLVLEEAAGVDVLLHLGDISLGKIVQSGETRKQGRGHLVNPLIGALGRQAHGNEKLVIMLIVQRAHGVRVGLLQSFDDR